jgi:DNA repair protein RadC
VLLVKDCTEPRPDAASACLYVRSGSQYLPASNDAILDYIRNWAVERFRPGALVLDCPEAVEAFLLSELATREIEVVALILLDNAHRLIDYVELAQGTRDSAPIPTRAVVRTALRHDACGIILVHNHPCGRAEPSHADILATQRVKTVLEMMQVRLIDHFIVGNKIMSFAQRGLIS